MATIFSICNRVSSGGTPKSTESSFYGGNIPWLNTKEIDFNFIESTEKTITEEGLNNSSAKWVEAPSVIVAMYGATAGKVAIANIKLTTNQACCNLNIDPTKADYRFVFYALKNDYIRLSSMANGGAQQNLNAQQIKDFEIPDFSLLEQKKIATILSSLDAKIETNRKINAKLEELAQVIFKSWFIDFEPFGGKMPDDWEIKSLSEIASYMNGLAMQKYPPMDKEDKLPVLKIKELGDGKLGENSDFCSKNTIGHDYIIGNSDIIFSWSGTLLVKIWTGGECGLNQHLFKVTSNKYPKWFYYYWTLYHNENFKRVAKDKAVTMGHIKREELDKAKVNVPSSDIFKQVDSFMSPIFKQIICTCLESSQLAELRDTLQPKLMLGEIKV